MGNSKLRSKDLRKIKYESNETISLALGIMAKHYKYESKAAKLQILESVLTNPKNFIDNENLSQLADCFIETKVESTFIAPDLLDTPKPYRVYGKKLIDNLAIQQMDIAMRLPIAEAGALMPDAHLGYGLPIGGVLATKNEVIPYAVGLDIGCRMCLTVYPENDRFIHQYRHNIKLAIKEHSHFGVTKKTHLPTDHEVLNRSEFQEILPLKLLMRKAAQQLGTSGSGNHFVEAGTVELPEGNQWNIKAGRYFGILTHSGSRAVGATIASYYTKIAVDKCRLPRGAKHLAWLDLDTEEGWEYWLSMNLAGDYAQACHDIIHERLANALGIKPMLKVENHHNFAWKEKQADGSELIVHRKGSTPASKGELGIIPATMIDPGYIVSGLGNADSLNSASHGAGRRLSRTKAKASITGSDMKKMLKHSGITLMGGGVDEAPIAYKKLDEVMAMQTELVKIEGAFYPKIVRMDKA